MCTLNTKATNLSLHGSPCTANYLTTQVAVFPWRYDAEIGTANSASA